MRSYDIVSILLAIETLIVEVFFSVWQCDTSSLIIITTKISSQKTVRTCPDMSRKQKFSSRQPSFECWFFMRYIFLISEYFTTTPLSRGKHKMVRATWTLRPRRGLPACDNNSIGPVGENGQSISIMVYLKINVCWHPL